jgi:nucleotide-binding universal stress UspA family protein
VATATTFNRVLCPVDFSEYSQRALRHALAIARRNQSELTVLHAEDLMEASARAEVGLHTPVLGSAESELRAFLDATDPRDFARINVMIRSGNAVQSIIGHAAHDRSDLIVMGTRGRSGLRAILGSVTERVLREARCPVLTIPPAATGPAMEEFEPYNPILCASDFSPSCRKALSLGLSVAQEADARLILLHVLQFPANNSGLMPLQPIIVDPIDRTESRREALLRLKGGLASEAPLRCHPEAIVVEGNPSEAILRIAEDEQVGLIVMGVESRGAIDRMLFGSTTRRVIHAARCPVLSIRADKHDPAWVAAKDLAQQPIGA